MPALGPPLGGLRVCFRIRTGRAGSAGRAWLGQGPQAWWFHVEGPGRRQATPAAPARRDGGQPRAQLCHRAWTMSRIALRTLPCWITRLAAVAARGNSKSHSQALGGEGWADRLILPDSSSPVTSLLFRRGIHARFLAFP